MDPFESPQQPLLQWQQTFADYSCKLTAPNNQISKKFINSLLEDPRLSDPMAKFPNILANRIDIPDICSIDLRSSSTVFTPTQFNFLSDALKKMKDLKNPSIHFISFIQKEDMTTAWRKFYFQAFLQETFEKTADFKFISRFKEYEGNSTGVNNLNALLDDFNSRFKDIRDFSFVNANLEDFYCIDHLKFCQNIMKKSARSLEKILFFTRTNYLYISYLKIFEQLELLEFNQLKSFRIRIALGGTEDFSAHLLTGLPTNFKNIYESKKLPALKELGLFLANFHFEFQHAKELIKTIRKSIKRMESVILLLQTDLNNYSIEEMNNLLTLIFNKKSQTLNYFSLGFCADRQQIARETVFSLDHFGKLLKENTWTLLRFQLYYEVKKGVTKGEVKEFLLILVNWLKFCTDVTVKLMSCGTDLLEEIGANEIIEKHFKTKKKSILMTSPLNRLRKVFRVEIVHEILEKFF